MNIIDNLTEEERTQIQTFGALEYDYFSMYVILGWPEDKFKEHTDNTDSEFNFLLAKGRIMSKYRIDISLLRAAQDGDVKSLDVLEKRILQRLTDS